MNNTLKRCPFCGGMAEVRHVTPYSDKYKCKQLGFFVMCEKCLTSSDNYRNSEEAVKHWNNRINSD